MKIALVTGGGSGLGKGIVENLIKNNIFVYIVGRNEVNLLSLRKKYPQNIKYIVADVSKDKDRKLIKDKLTNVKLDYLINNAGILEPIGRISKITLAKWKKIQSINVEAPLFITKYLLSNFNFGARVLNISSGAGHNAYPGLLAYCTSKAALLMISQSLNLLLKDYNVYVGSIMPGAVDTNMQLILRSQDKKDLPQVEARKDQARNNELYAPEYSGKLITDFLLNTTNSVFTKKDWRVTEFE